MSKSDRWIQTTVKVEREFFYKISDLSRQSMRNRIIIDCLEQFIELKSKETNTPRIETLRESHTPTPEPTNDNKSISLSERLNNMQ